MTARDRIIGFLDDYEALCKKYEITHDIRDTWGTGEELVLIDQRTDTLILMSEWEEMSE